jgi:hypothetical protein
MTIDHISWEILSVDEILCQLSYFGSSKLYVYKCTDDYPLNYYNFTLHVQIHPQVTVGAVLSVATPTRRHALQ